MVISNRTEIYRAPLTLYDYPVREMHWAARLGFLVKSYGGRTRSEYGYRLSSFQFTELWW